MSSLQKKFPSTNVFKLVNSESGGSSPNEEASPIELANSGSFVLVPGESGCTSSISQNSEPFSPLAQEMYYVSSEEL